MSYHRACCCAACPDNVEIVISGVDAGICSACMAGSAFNSQKVLTLDYDGTYTIPYNSTTGGECLYAALTIAGTEIDREEWQSVDDCSGAADETGSELMRARVWVKEATVKIVKVILDHQTINNPSMLATPAFLYDDATGVAFGVSVTNEYTVCEELPSALFTGSNAGAVVVNRA